MGFQMTLLLEAFVTHSLHMHGFQMTLLLEAFVIHSLHMHRFHPACLSYTSHTCGTINPTVLYYHVASEHEKVGEISD